MRRWSIRLAILLALVIAAWLLKETVFAPKPLEVRLATVSPGLVEDTITNSRAGTVRARRRAKLSPEVGGQILEIPHREGDRVEAGAVLLQLDDGSQRASAELRRRELEAARAEENRACIAAERAQRETGRLRRLAEDSIVSVDLLDQAESAQAEATAACRAGRAQTARARAAEALARTELAKTVLHAPFTGVLAEIAVEVGEWTTPSPPGMPIPAVIDMLDPESVYISAPMDEVDSARVHLGQTVRVTVDSHRGRTYDGQISRVAPYVLDVQEQNRTVEVEAELDDPGLASSLLPGTSADLEVVLEVRDQVLRIPTEALLEGGRVFVLDGEVLDERELELGLRNWNFTEVVTGLEAGERVVISLEQAGLEDGREAVEAPAEPAAGNG